MCVHVPHDLEILFRLFRNQFAQGHPEKYEIHRKWQRLDKEDCNCDEDSWLLCLRQTLWILCMLSGNWATERSKKGRTPHLYHVGLCTLHIFHWIQGHHYSSHSIISMVQITKENVPRASLPLSELSVYVGPNKFAGNLTGFCCETS